MFGKKKELRAPTEQKCQAPGCPFTCNDPVSLKKHTDWKHPGQAATAGAK